MKTGANNRWTKGRAGAFVAAVAALAIVAGACDGQTQPRLVAGVDPSVLTISAATSGSIDVTYAANFGGAATATVVDIGGTLIDVVTFDGSTVIDLDPGTYTVIIEETSGEVPSGSGAISGANLVSSGPLTITAGETTVLDCSPSGCS